MRKSLVLVLVVALLGAIGLWQVLREDARARGTNRGPATLPAAAPEDARAPATLVPAEAPASTERSIPTKREKPAQAPALAVEHQDFDLDDARWLEVTVRIPRGVPLEDAPALIGFARKDAEDEDDAQDEDIDELDAIEVSQKLGLDDSFAQELGDTHHWSRRPLTSLVRLPFPPAASEGLLFVQSRYLHLDPVTVTLASQSTLTIEPELGGYVTGRCVFPPGDSVAIADLSLEFNGRARKDGLMGFARPDAREVRVDRDYSFELRALSSAKKYVVQGKATGFVSYFELSFEIEPGQHRDIELPFRRGASVSGVVRGEGAPLAGARISADLQGGMPWDEDVEGESGQDGTFRLAGIPEGKLVLHASLDGWLDASSDPLELVEGQALGGIVLELPLGQRVSGTVRWPDGTPVENAEVRVVELRERWGLEKARVMSDSEGAFSVGGLAETRVDVFATREKPGGSPPPVLPARAGVTPSPPLGAEDSWSALVSDIAPGTSGLALTLQPPLPVVGSVRDDSGAPLKKFRVEAKPSGRPRNSPEEQSFSFETEAGDFTLGVPRSGAWVFVAEQDNGDRRSEEVSLSIPQGGEALVLVIPRGNTLAGVVLAPDGTPTEGAQIHVIDDPRQAGFGFFGDGQAKSGSDGRFTLSDAKPGSSLQATHPDWAASEPLMPTLRPGEAHEDLVLLLRQGGRITGEVFDAEGKPESGKNVTCASGAMAAMAFGFGGGNSTTSDSTGRFEFEHVTPGKVTVSAVPSEEEFMQKLQDGADETAVLGLMSDMRSASVEVADGGEAHVVLGAKPKKPVRVHGLVSEAGSTLGETQVIVFAEGGALFQGMKFARTDASGRYEIVLDRPGDYVFGVSQDDGFQGTGAPFYVEVPEADAFELDLALPLGRIAGSVHGPDGPLGAIPVRLVSSEGLMGLDDLSESNRDSTGADGSFELQHLNPGTYTLEVGSEFGGGGENPRFGQVVVDGIRIEKDRAVEGLLVRLEPPGTLAGLVRDADHNPVGGVSIFVRDSAGRAISASDCVSDAAGRFTYEGITPGRATASAKGARLVSPESAGIDIRAGATSRLELVVAPGTFLKVALLDGDKEVRARLRVVDQDGRRVDGLFAMEDIASLLSEGFSSRERRVGPLAPGKYTLTATTLDGKDAKKSVSVEAGQEERVVKLRLK